MMRYSMLTGYSPVTDEVIYALTTRQSTPTPGSRHRLKSAERRAPVPRGSEVWLRNR